MDSKKLSIRLVLLIIVIFLLNYLAMKFHWYLSVWYLDMPMHFLGGFWLGLVMIWLLKIKSLTLKVILQIIAGVIFIGILWEIFEIIVNENITGTSFNILDTISDMFLDLAGGFLAIFYFIKKVMFVSESNIYGLPYSNSTRTLYK
jgi:hypothetical protein